VSFGVRPRCRKISSSTHYWIFPLGNFTRLRNYGLQGRPQHRELQLGAGSEKR
jgi:hypothetical protein